MRFVAILFAKGSQENNNAFFNHFDHFIPPMLNITTV